MGLISSWGNGQEPAPPTLTDFSVPLRGQFRRLSQLLRINQQLSGCSGNPTTPHNQQLSGCSGNPTTPHQGVVIIIIILNEFVKVKIMKVEEQNLSAPQPTVSKGSKPHSVEVLSLLSIAFKFLCEHHRVDNDNDPQHNAVVTESLEIVLADIAHEELDGKDRDHKGYDHTD